MNKVANEPLVHEDDEAGLKGFPASMPLEDLASEMQLKSIITQPTRAAPRRKPGRRSRCISGS